MSSIPQNRLRRRLKRILKILLILYVMITASLYFLQEKLLFLPTSLDQEYEYSFKYPFEEVFLKPSDKVSLNAIHFKSESPKGVILYFHGNAGDLSRWGIVAEYFVAKEYDVFIMDYRTYGKSKGKLSEQGFYDDAQYCYDYLLKQYDEKDMIVFGRSLGTGLASYVASENHPKQLILETPFYSLLDVAKRRFPIFPVSSLLRYKFPSHKFISSVECPITIVHGTEDYVVPYDSAQRLFEVAPKTNITFVTIEGGGHNNLISFNRYRDTMDALLQ
ncbi:alpha/beta hydrolase [Psychroserpens sp. XS_ASV72]|uniref:alpha/beta hydrolase n=1 Tax=Psychroserpens sp. XS_ASV72 TaxID=3241293 RepID=UPI003515AAD4